MPSSEPPPIRIGNDERAAAMTALDEHLAKGRLGVEEYGDRSAAAANAVFAADLAQLFTDLPAPHPALPGVPAGPGDTAAVSLAKPAADPATVRSGGALEMWGPRLVAAAPILALVLFLVTKQWWWFLLIPALGAVVYGGPGRHGRRRDR